MLLLDSTSLSELPVISRLVKFLRFLTLSELLLSVVNLNMFFSIHQFYYHA